MDAKHWDSDEEKRCSPENIPTFSDLLKTRLQTRKPIDNTELFAGKQKETLESEASMFGFSAVSAGVDGTHHVAKGYRADILISWGDPVMGDAPEFNANHQTPEAQEKQFGYNNDSIVFLPLPRGSKNPDHGLLVVNHEYTSRKLMFPDHKPKKEKKADYELRLCQVEMAAHGLSILEIEKNRKGRWQTVRFSPYNRRITPLRSVLDISGPAAGDARMQTKYDPDGFHVIGTLNNCASSITPWGTFLSAEENFNGYFLGHKKDHPDKLKLKRYGIPGKWFDWGKHDSRFNIDMEPNEPNRFGWIVEVDPYNPNARPVKRTALGRFKHKGAGIVLNADGRVVVYSADDQQGEYLYKFVSYKAYDNHDRRANFSLLDEGTLYVAKLDHIGNLDWLPLVYGHAGLNEENGFNSQADVLIDTRLAADLVGATPLDRPEDVVPNPENNHVYLMLPGVEARANEGRILELIPPQGDHTALQYRWDLLLQTNVKATTHKHRRKTDPKPDKQGLKKDWFVAPDNCAVDGQGRLWVTTDQGEDWGRSGSADGIWAVETQGRKKGAARMFFRVPVGAEMAGPAFTPDDKTMFISVQHPGSDGAKDYPPFARESTFSDPVTRWPDFNSKQPPRPSVVVVVKKDGGVVGS